LESDAHELSIIFPIFAVRFQKTVFLIGFEEKKTVKNSIATAEQLM